MTLTTAQWTAIAPFAGLALGRDASGEWRLIEEDRAALTAFVASPATTPLGWEVLEYTVRPVIREAATAKAEEARAAKCPALDDDFDFAHFFHCPAEPHADADGTSCPVHAARAESGRLGMLWEAIEEHVEQMRDEEERA